MSREKTVVGVKLHMSEFEICSMYKNAADRTEEIGILAQLNNVSKKSIINVLNNRGICVCTCADDIVDKFVHGASIEDVATECGISTLTVKKRVYEKGYSISKIRFVRKALKYINTLISNGVDYTKYRCINGKDKFNKTALNFYSYSEYFEVLKYKARGYDDYSIIKIIGKAS